MDENKRLVVIYHALKGIENGLLEPGYSPKYNVPEIVVPKGPKDNPRYRPAYDLRLLNILCFPYSIISQIAF